MQIATSYNQSAAIYISLIPQIVDKVTILSLSGTRWDNPGQMIGGSVC